MILHYSDWECLKGFKIQHRDHSETGTHRDNSFGLLSETLQLCEPCVE